MPTTSSRLRYPALTDSPNGPLQVGNLAADLDAKVLPDYANIAARNTAIPSPTQGRSCTVTGIVHTYDGTAWRWQKRGFTNATTDVNGAIIVVHGLGAAPTGVLLTPAGQASDLLNRIIAMVYTASDTSNFVALAKRTDTSAWLASTQIQFAWSAYV